MIKRVMAKSTMISSKTAAAALIVAAIFPLFHKIAFAHPHIFTESRIEIDADEHLNFSQIRHVWRFDELFSATMLLDHDTNGDGDLSDKELVDVAKTIKLSISEYDFFTHVTVKGKKVKMKVEGTLGTDYDVTTKQFLAFFTLKPVGKINLKKAKLDIAIYDPTFFVAFDYAEQTAAGLFGGASLCKHQIIWPDFDALAEKSAELAEIDANTQLPDTIGQLYATHIEVKCK